MFIAHDDSAKVGVEPVVSSYSTEADLESRMLEFLITIYSSLTLTKLICFSLQTAKEGSK